jgi:hypothetical protein
VRLPARLLPHGLQGPPACQASTLQLLPLLIMHQPCGTLRTE